MAYARDRRVHQFFRGVSAAADRETARMGRRGRDLFHISDEPREEHLESYKAAKESLGHMLDGFQTFDTLSSYEFYKHVAREDIRRSLRYLPTSSDGSEKLIVASADDTARRELREILMPDYTVIEAMEISIVS